MEQSVQLEELQAYTQATEDLCAALIYLQDNVLLQQPQKNAHLKPHPGRSGHNNRKWRERAADGSTR